MDHCPDCEGDGAHADCYGRGCHGCDPDTGNCPTCAGTGNHPKYWRRPRS